jgi:ATP-binding cassette subfamily B protein
MLWVGKLIIDEVILQTGLTDPDYRTLWKYVGLEFALAIASDLLGRGISLTDGLLGDLYSNASSVRIIQKTKEMEMAQFEDPEFYDKLERARTQTNGRVSLMSNALGQAQSLISAVALTAGLVYFEPWLILLLAFSIIPAFFNARRLLSK